MLVHTINAATAIFMRLQEFFTSLFNAGTLRLNLSGPAGIQEGGGIIVALPQVERACPTLLEGDVEANDEGLAWCRW